jgi:hypothetical protein
MSQYAKDGLRQLAKDFNEDYYGEMYLNYEWKPNKLNIVILAMCAEPRPGQIKTIAKTLDLKADYPTLVKRERLGDLIEEMRGQLCPKDQSTPTAMTTLTSWPRRP